MKKLLIISVLCMVMVFYSSFAYAAGLDDWTNLPGMLVDGKNVPAELTMTDKGLQFYQAAGYYGDDGNYTGAILNTPVDINNFSIEFTIDQVPAYGIDSWVGLHLLNKKAYFSVGNPAQAQGVVTLIRASSDQLTNFQTFEHVSGFNQIGDVPLKESPVGTFKVELKKNDEGKYIYYANGEAIATEFSSLSEAFPDGKAYLVIGASTNNGKPTQFTITKINGEPVAAPAAAETKDTSNPKTGDAGMIPYIVMTGASLLGIGTGVISRKRK